MNVPSNIKKMVRKLVGTSNRIYTFSHNDIDFEGGFSIVVLSDLNFRDDFVFYHNKFYTKKGFIKTYPLLTKDIGS